MTDTQDLSGKPPIQLPPNLTVLNPSAPLRLKNIELTGFSAGAALADQMVQVWVRLSITSDEPIFHRMSSAIVGHLTLRAQQVGHYPNLRDLGCFLLVVHPDNTGDLWLEPAVTQHILLKRNVQPGEAIFDNDIADLIGMSFPAVPIAAADRVLCVFREGWRFAMFFDLDRDKGELSLPNMQRDLGTLVRSMRYAETYESLADGSVVERLTSAGWFPFAEMLGRETAEMLQHVQAGFPLDLLENQMLDAFPRERVERMLDRWLARPHFEKKRLLLESAVRAYQAGEPVPVIKTVLTEIEGILNEAYRLKHGKGTRRIDKLLRFAVESAEGQAGGADTLLFPAAFGRYMRDYVFQDFDLDAANGKANSRHAVGHGAADPTSYTMVRALQALLTIDQLSFYTTGDVQKLDRS